jgi:HD-like signal output (HDOD) protein
MASDIVPTPEERAAALAFLRQLAAEASRGTIDLPCFPNVVIRISTALTDPRTTSEHVVTIAGAEPRFAARLLQTANSAAFNTAGRQLTDLRSAITRLGHRMVQGIAISYAVQQMQNEESLRAVAAPMAALWNTSIAVASISQLIAQRTKVNPEEAFLAGLLHGIGSLYIMARAAGQSMSARDTQSRMDLLSGWQASIGKAVLESWGFAEALCSAVGDQRDYERGRKHGGALTDILIASLVLADALRAAQPRSVDTQGINAFLSIGLTAADCPAILAAAEVQIAAVHDALK